MKRIAKFEKVSIEKFCEGMIQGLWIENDFNNIEKHKRKRIEEIYTNIKLPERKTIGSAGYDFHIPFDITLSPGQSVLIPTGIRCSMEPGWVLNLYPRSSLGFKYRLQLNNTVGIIDSDYYHSDNEGHIMAKITNDSIEGSIMKLNAGDGFIQGIFVEYGITVDDETDGVRNGGTGSTTGK